MPLRAWHLKRVRHKFCKGHVYDAALPGSEVIVGKEDCYGAHLPQSQAIVPKAWHVACLTLSGREAQPWAL